MRNEVQLFGLRERDWIRTFWLLALAGVTWRLVRFAVGMPIWGDEAMLGLNIVGRDFSGLMLPLDLHQVAPVVYLWLQKAVQLLLGPNEYSMRSVAMVEGLAALFILGALLRRLGSLQEAVFGFGIIAVGTYSVRHSVELKPYAQDLLASCLVWYGLVRYLEKPTWQRLLLLGTILAVAVLSSFPAIFVAGGAIAAVVLFHRERLASALPQMAVLFAMALTSFAIVYLHSIKGQLGRHETGMISYWSEAFPPSDPAAFPLWFLKAHTGNLMAYPFGGKNFGSSLTTLVVLVGLLVLIKRRNWVLLAALIVPFALTFIAAALHRYPYGLSARVSQHLVPAIALLAGIGICALIRRIPSEIRQKQTVLALMLALLAIAVGGSVRDILRPYKIRGVYEARAAVNQWLSEVSPRDQLESLARPEEWDACMQWLLLPIAHRITGPGWQEVSPSTFGKFWILNDQSHRNVPELIQLRWPGARILSHRVDDFWLTPPNPHRQRFEYFAIQQIPKAN